MKKKYNMAVGMEAAVVANPLFSRFRCLPVVQELSTKECTLLFLCFEEQRISMDTVIYRIHEKSEGAMSLILQGSVSVSDASTHVYSILNAGDVFGLFSFLDRERVHSASIRAESDLTLLSLKRDFFDVITIENPALGNQLLRFMFRLLTRMSLKLEIEYAALRRAQYGNQP